EVRDHQYGNVDDRDPISGAQLARQGRKAELGGVIIVDDEVGDAHDIEGDDKQPKERTYPHGEERQHGKYPGREVAVGGEGSKARWQIADNARKNEDESEETKAVQRSDGAVRVDVVRYL